MFFVDQDVTDVGDAVVAGRLPYDRVSITGTDSFTFSSNDVVSVVDARVCRKILPLEVSKEAAAEPAESGLNSCVRTTIWCLENSFRR